MKQVAQSNLTLSSRVVPALRAVLVSDWIQMSHVSDLLPFPVTAGDRGSRLLWWRWRRPPPYPTSQGLYKNRWAQREGEGLAAGVLAVFSGIHYLARLKIHQRLPRLQHMVHLNFTASCSQQLSLIWGAAWSTVHQGNVCAHKQAHTHTHIKMSQMHKERRWIQLIQTTKREIEETSVHWHFYDKLQAWI